MFCRVAFFSVFIALVCSAVGNAARINDVRNTKHNLSVSGPGTVKASTETRVCVFCHTPHQAN
ncbi:Cytochrome c family protein, partial [hydrothermal vent metagenome]